MSGALERVPHRRTAVTPRLGRSSVTITCPCCGTDVRAYVWSLAGSGKRCPEPTCRALHVGGGDTIPNRRPAIAAGWRSAEVALPRSICCAGSAVGSPRPVVRWDELSYEQALALSRLLTHEQGRAASARWHWLMADWVARSLGLRHPVRSALDALRDFEPRSTMSRKDYRSGRTIYEYSREDAAAVDEHQRRWERERVGAPWRRVLERLIDRQVGAGQLIDDLGKIVYAAGCSAEEFETARQRAYVAALAAGDELLAVRL